MKLCSFDGPDDGVVLQRVDLFLYEETARGSWDEVATGEANSERTVMLVAQSLWDEWRKSSSRSWVRPRMRLQLKVGEKFLRHYTERPT